MKAIISLATDRGRYIDGLARLANSLKGKFNEGVFLGFINEATVGAPAHLMNPYAFKIYAFNHARKLGFRKILWLDASVWAIKDVSPVFEVIEREGIFMQEAGAYLGNWCNDFTLKYFGLSRDEAMNILCYGNAGMLGIDFDSEIGRDFFCDWEDAMLAGCFRGEWNNDNKTESEDERCKGHRHDLATGAAIANRLGIQFKSGNEWLEYAQPDSEPKNDTIIFQASGL